MTTRQGGKEKSANIDRRATGMTITAKDHRLALVLVAKPGTYKLTEVELRACRAIIDNWPHVRDLGDEDTRIARTLLATIRRSMEVRRGSTSQ